MSAPDYAATVRRLLNDDGRHPGPAPKPAPPSSPIFDKVSSGGRVAPSAAGDLPGGADPLRATGADLGGGATRPSRGGPSPFSVPRGGERQVPATRLPLTPVLLFVPRELWKAYRYRAGLARAAERARGQR